MKNQIIIHGSANQTRVALIENGELAQLFIESPENQRTVGNIYLAEVHKVMSGIRAAFISMGTQKDAFLHFSDTGEHLENYLIMLNGKDAVPKQALKKAEAIRDNQTNVSITEEQNRTGALLAPRQKVLVQIVKEPIGSKGPRVSTNITVAGRFLVLIPMGEYVAVSKRIRSHRERRRLRSCLSKVLPDGFGVIVRTLAEGQKDTVLHEDLKDVLEKWSAIQEKLKEAKPPSLLHQDMDMTESLIRDLYAKDYHRILIDDAKIYRGIKSYVSRVAPNMVPNIELYKGSEHIFDYMKISRDVDSVFSPRVKMPSGGYLIFEQTEAMYVVDVNSGRYAAKKEQEENSLKTNLESAREIAKQLRLRDIGGIIVVDFIDLREDTNRKKIYDELKREFRKDRAKTNVLPMSDFGLVQITRQRIRPSVVKSVSKVCPMCGGSGSIVTQNTILVDIESWLTKFKHSYKGYYTIDLHLNPYLRSMMQKGWVSQRIKWFFSHQLNVHLLGDETLSMNDFKFMLHNSEIDITETVLKNQPIEKAISEADLAQDVSGEKKKDDPGLDYYKKEQKKPGRKPSSPRSRKQTGSASSKPTSRSTAKKEPGRNTAGKPKPDVKDTRGKSAAPKLEPQKKGGGDRAEQAEEAKQIKQSEKNLNQSEKETASRSAADTTTDKSATAVAKRPSVASSQTSRRSSAKAKYYKSSQDAAGENSGSPGKKDSDTGNESKDSDTGNKSTGSEPKTPPSAIEVAREHRLKKEREAQSEKKAQTEKEAKVEKEVPAEKETAAEKKAQTKKEAKVEKEAPSGKSE